ncbi:MAG: UV DNA damage repair endonuclease UvsE [Chloroflexota bacterium]
MRLGFACKVLGADIPSHDARKWQSSPHLRVSLGYLDRMFEYLHDHHVRMYRMSSDVAPYYTDPSRPQFAHQLQECEQELKSLGTKARAYDIRLSTHPGQYVVLNSPHESVYQAAVRDLEYHATLLDMMEMPDTAKMILHIGGVYGEREQAIQRFILRYCQLSDRIRARMVLENDDKSYPIHDVLHVHSATGAPVVFDVLHHRVLNPQSVAEGEALGAALATWPAGQTPKIHYSDERTEPRLVKRGGQLVEVAPARGQHADFIDAEPFASFIGRYGGNVDFDVMLEAKSKDLALFRLRDELAKMGALPSAA